MLQRIKAILKQRRFEIYTRPNELNIVGLRSKSVRANRFDDEIHVFYKTDKKKWNYHLYKATTDPGTYWLENPSYPQGTAILHEGQYKNAYAIGKHRGKYYALIQLNPVTVTRDYDRNAVLDFNNGNVQVGMFGIDIHHAKSKGKTLTVDEYSAGCQVFQSADDFEEFMNLCQKHKELYGNQFTYTLIDFRALRRITWKRIAMAASFLSTMILGIFFSGNKKKKK
jgi:hypothetical protein